MAHWLAGVVRSSLSNTYVEVGSMKGRGTSLAPMLALASLLSAVVLGAPAGPAVQGAGAAGQVSEAAPAPFSVLETGEIPELRSRTSRTFLEEPGTYRLEAYAGSINYQDHAGIWQPIDNTLLPSLKPGYALRNKANRYSLELPAALSLAPVRISEGARWISYSLEGAEGLLASNGSRASYRGALPQVAINYEALADSVKEMVVLASADAPSSFRFLVHASPGLSADVDRRAVVFRDADGKTAFAFTPPFMVDANGALSEQVDFSLERLAEGWALTLTADRAWLAASERRFPVAIDPTTFVGPFDGTTPYATPGRNCSLKSGQAELSFCSDSVLEVGTEAGSTRRALVDFDSINTLLPSMSTVLTAALKLKLQQTPSSSAALDVHRVSRAWTTNLPSWNRYDGVNYWTTAGGDFDAVPLSSQTVGPSSTTVSWRVTSAVLNWVNAGPQHGFIVKAASEGSAPVFRFYANIDEAGAPPDPYLSIRYRHRTGALRQYSFDTQELSDRQSVGVNLANANVLVQASDLAIAGTGLDLEIDRYYNSHDFIENMNREPIGSVGRGWTLSLGADVGLEIYDFDGGTAAFYGPSGFTVVFEKQQDGSFKPLQAGLDAKLTQSGGTYTLTFNHTGLKYEFNSAGFFTREVERNGNDILYGYDGQNRLTTITDTQDRVATATYNAQGLIETLTDSTGRVVRYGYDANKRLTSVTDAAGKVTTYAYDTQHRLTKITDPLLQETRFTYYWSDDRIEATVKRVTDPATGAGSLTNYQACPRGKLLCPPGESNYYEAVPRTLVTDPNGNKTLFYTDVHSRVHKVKDALSHVQSAQLNPNHDPDSFTTATNNTTYLTYFPDGTNNLKDTKIPTDDDLTEQWLYEDTTNNPFLPTRYTDPQGKITNYTYDASGNLETVTNALGRTARTYYNANGTVKGVLDFKGIVNGDCPPTPAVTVCYGYDGQGNLTSVNNPSPLGDVTLTYDALSRVRTVTDGRNQVTTYDYDALDRVDLITYQGGSTIDYAYDANGNLKTLIDNTGTTTYDYDKLNRLTKETLPGPKVNDYTYDAGSNTTSFTDQGGTVTYVYNAVNDVAQVIEPNASPIVLDYHDDNLRKRITYPNGISQCFWYDISDRIEFVWSQRSTDCTKNNPTPPPRITDYTYTYKRPGTQIDTGLIQTVADKAGNVTTYTYDDVRRLQQAQTVGPNLKTFAYSYDHNSNRLTQTIDGTQTTTYTYNDADQLKTDGGPNFTYDGNGNELNAPSRRTSTYNAKDQLDSLTPQGQPTIAMSYTGMGQFRRVARGSTTFTNSALGVTREDSTSYTVDPDGVVLGQRNGTRTYFVHDGLGSVVATTTEAGAESAIARYEPFGKCLANCPAGAYGWLGGLGVYLDSATGLYKMGTRYYDPALGRFTQVDPVEGVAANRYDYAGQDAINVADPDGTCNRLLKRLGLSNREACDAERARELAGRAPGVVGRESAHQLRKNAGRIANAAVKYSVLGATFAAGAKLAQSPEFWRALGRCASGMTRSNVGYGPADPFRGWGRAGALIAGCLHGLRRGY
jgi:RHS repeat-associated protein